MIDRSKALYVLGGVALLLSAMSAHAGVFFVDALEGDDANSGRPNAPFATVERGVAAAAEQTGDDTVIIRAGNYTENVVINDVDALTLSGRGAEIAAGDDEAPTLAIVSGDVKIRGLSITGGDPGIEAEPGDDANVSLVLLDCTVGGNNGRGVKAEKVDFVRIVGGTYNGNDGDGIKIEKVDTVHVEGAEFVGNDSDGLDLEENGSIALIRLIVKENGDEGIEVDDSESIFVRECQVSDNRDDGLDLDNTAQVKVVNCVSTGNGDGGSLSGNGLQVEADDEEFPVDSVVIINSVFSGNRENGIHVVEDGAVVGLVALTAITVEANQLSGARVEVTGDVRFNQILSNGNGEGDILP